MMNNQNYQKESLLINSFGKKLLDMLKLNSTSKMDMFIYSKLKNKDSLFTLSGIYKTFSKYFQTEMRIKLEWSLEPQKTIRLNFKQKN